MKLYYSVSPVKTANVNGFAYRNPRMFAFVEPGVESVLVFGRYPKIVDAYKHAQVSVQVIMGEAEMQPGASTANKLAEKELVGMGLKSDAVPIPDSWEELEWNDLRKLAASIANRPIPNKAEATDVITKELHKRSGIIDG